MNTVDQTLALLDSKLDEVDELLNQLPVSNERKHQLTSIIYNLWMEVTELPLESMEPALASEEVYFY